MIDAFSAVNAILACATVGLFTSLFLVVFAWMGIFPAIIIDSVGVDVDEDEGA